MDTLEAQLSLLEESSSATKAITDHIDSRFDQQIWRARKVNTLSYHYIAEIFCPTVFKQQLWSNAWDNAS